MNDLNDLYYFVRVVDHGGFAAAGRATNMQKSKLSRRILQLEERLGVRLVNRSTRQFSVTDIGRDYYERCVAMLVEAEAADRLIAEVRMEPKGLVRVSCPGPLMQWGFGPLFARFMAENLGVEIILENSNRQVDVIGEGFDIAIRAGLPPFDASDLVMRKLGTIPLSLVGAPTLLDGRSVSSPDDLPNLSSIAVGPSQRDHQWRLEREAGQTSAVPFSPRFVSDDMFAVRAAAAAGVGIAGLPSTIVKDDIASGALAHVLPGWTLQAILVHAVFPSRRGMLPSVRSLLDFLVAEVPTAGQDRQGA